MTQPQRGGNVQVWTYRLFGVIHVASIKEKLQFT